MLSVARLDTAFWAAGEIESICDVLLRELGDIDPEHLACRGLVIRARSLNSVVLSVLGKDDSRQDEELTAVVQGTNYFADHTA